MNYGQILYGIEEKLWRLRSFSGAGEEERQMDVFSEIQTGARALRTNADNIGAIRARIPYPDPYPLRIDGRIQDIMYLFEELATNLEAGQYEAATSQIDSIDHSFDGLEYSLSEASRACEP